jgi:hypothetical protein
MRTLSTMLDFEAGRNPELAQLVERAATLTDEEIAQAPGLAWIGKALTERRQKARGDLLRSEIEPLIEITFAEETPGNARRWPLESTFMRFGRSELMIDTATLLWFPEAGGVWCDSTFSPSIDPRLTACVSEGQMMRAQYLELRRQDKLRACPIDAPVLSMNPTAVSERDVTLARYGVRIQR